MKALLLALVVGLSACAPQVVKTVHVDVPVIVRAVPPVELVACGHIAPGFTFKDGLEGSVILLPPDQMALQNWVNEKNQCLDAWHEWAVK